MSSDTYRIRAVALRGERTEGSGVLEITWNSRGRGTWEASAELQSRPPALGEDPVSVVIETVDGPVLRGLGVVMPGLPRPSAGAGAAVMGWVRIVGAGSFRLG